MPWYWCYDFYEYGNIIKAKNHKEAKKIFYYHRDHADEMEWINIRCRRLKPNEYDEEWLEKHLNEYGISYTPTCKECGYFTFKPHDLVDCPICKMHSYSIEEVL